MKPLLAALGVGLITTALQVGAASAGDPPVGVVAADATAPSYAASGDSSRYRFYNGYWWYWMPDNHWVCYVNGQWVNPGPPLQASVPVQATAVYPPQYYTVVPEPCYAPYPYGYYSYPYSAGGISLGLGFGGGWGGYWHGGFHR